MMAETDKDLKALDDLFATARRTSPAMPTLLADRILEDAADVQIARAEVAARRLAPHPSAPATLRPALRLWRQFQAAIGGWPAVGGLMAASLTGLWIGLAPPTFLPDPAELAQLAATTGSTDSVPFESFDLAYLLDEESQ